MKQSPMPARTKPMQRTPFKRTNAAKKGAELGRNLGGGKVAQTHSKRTARRETGFSAAAKLAIRKRAGNGDVEDARCEACFRWLGRYGGEVHHRCNRQMGGSRLRNRLSNAALVCGTPFTFCHGKCTALDEEMRAQGFVLNSGQDSLAEPIMLHGAASGLLVWLDDVGNYLDAQGNVIGGAA